MLETVSSGVIASVRDGASAGELNQYTIQVTRDSWKITRHRRQLARKARRGDTRKPRNPATTAEGLAGACGL